MNPRHGKLVALASALTIGIAATATAGGGGVTGLAPGGRTLAGPATARIEMQATETIYTHPATNTNACVTVAGVLGAAVRMALVGSNTSTFDVPVGGSGSLCKDSLVRMDLTCLGTATCMAQWRRELATREGGPMVKCNVLAATACLLLSSSALAGCAPAGLAAGGRTLAGPGVTAVAANTPATVYGDPSGNSNTCVTVVNAGTAAVRLSLTDGGTPSTIDVPVGDSGALCKDSTQQVDLTCLAAMCRANWRVDRY